MDSSTETKVTESKTHEIACPNCNKWICGLDKLEWHPGLINEQINEQCYHCKQQVRIVRVGTIHYVCANYDGTEQQKSQKSNDHIRTSTDGYFLDLN